jgi:hypothetical protein
MLSAILALKKLLMFHVANHISIFLRAFQTSVEVLDPEQHFEKD